MDYTPKRKMSYLELQLCKVSTNENAREMGTVWVSRPHLNNTTVTIQGVAFRARLDNNIGEHCFALNAKARNELKLDLGSKVAVRLV